MDGLDVTIYRGFASVYDALQDVDYEQWADRLDGVLRAYANETHPVRQVLDLACGTGAVTIPMAKRGYRMEGIDRSEEMLAVAGQKAGALSPAIRPQFYAMDMRSFALRNRYDAILSICDGGNYLLTDEDMQAMLRTAAEHLRAKGLFLLDMSSRYKLEEVIGDRTIAESYDGGAFLWENEIDRDAHRLSFQLTLFQRIDGSDRFERHIEYHEQRGYGAEELVALASPWLECIAILDGESFEEANSESERLLWILQRR